MRIVALIALSLLAGGSDDLDAYLKEREAQGFSGAVHVRVGGRTLVDRGYGLADRERKTGVTAETVFEVGSITKVFTAATVIRLAEEGRLSLDHRLPRFFSKVPRAKRAITVRQLLAHRSGLPEYPGYGDLAPLTRPQAVRNALGLPLRFRPGTRTGYSNVGYTVLAAIVEVVTREPFAAAVRRRVFTPAAMSRTGFSGERRWSAGELAVGYGNLGAPANARVSWSLQGAGGVRSTTGDLVKWVDAVRAGRVLTPRSVTLLYRLAIGPPGDVAYGGANAFGFQAVVVERRQDEALVVVLTNSNVLPNLVADDVARGLVSRIGSGRA